MSKYYIVRYQAGPIDMWLNTWLDYYDAFREAQSLNERDFKAYYYVTLGEIKNGKANDLRSRSDSQVPQGTISGQKSNVTRLISSKA